MLFVHLELRSTDMVDLWSCSRRKCNVVEQIYAMCTFRTEIHRYGRFVELYKKKVWLCGTNLYKFVHLELRSTDGVDLWSFTRRKCDFVEQIYAIRTFRTEIHRYGRFVELYKKANAALIVGPGGFCCKFAVRGFRLQRWRRRRRRRRGGGGGVCNKELTSAFLTA